MIVWIASFPRSGSSLVRQILFDTMGKRSYDEAKESDRFDLRYRLRMGRSPSEFYAWAAEVSDPVLVKTHEHPPDDSPAIYVVRDGRSALASFLQFERKFSPGSDTSSLLPLIFGAHHFGGWSEHYRAWHARSAPILTLQYGELFNADDQVLNRIASYIGYDGLVGPWQNPIGDLRRRDPRLVGQGKITWDPTDEWDAVCDAAFWCLHGELMRELGLDDDKRVAAPGEVSETVAKLAPFLMATVAQRRDLQREADAKEAVISGLAQECAKRLALIEELGRAADVAIPGRGRV